jgi:hypothetical protein
MYIKKRKDDSKRKDDDSKKKDEGEMSIKEYLNKMAGIDAEGKPLKYPDEDVIIGKIIDYEESVEILKEVLITPSFKEWWDKNAVEGVIVDHDTRLVVVPMSVELGLSYSKMKRLGIFAEEFGYTMAGKYPENL